MCLDSISKVKIAKKDLYVIKFMHFNDKNKNKLSSYYQSFQYKLNKTYELDSPRLKGYFNDKRYTYHHGFHSIMNPESSWGGSGLTYNIVVVLCKIPKGSKYVLGNNKDIVSNKIILKEIIWKYSKFSPKYWVNKNNVYRKCFKIIEQRFGKQEY